MRYRTVMLAVLLVVSVVGAAVPTAGLETTQSGEAYAGTHVQFETGSNAVADYAVDGKVLVRNVTMQSASQARSQTGVDVDVGLGAMTDVAGASVQSQTKASASVSIGFSSGGEMTAHDTQRGVVQFHANSDDQIVSVGVSSNSQAASEGEERVVVTKDDGSQGTFIVVGDGEVVVNDEGNVTAEVKEGSQLVYRQYDDGRDDNDEEAEQMIQQGSATAELYVQQAGESGEDSAEEGEETVVETIEYGQDTSVNVVSTSRSNVEMTVDRSQSQGKVVLATVSEEAFDNAQDVEVFVDGEAAARADSYSAVEQSATQGDQPRFHVAQASSAEAAVDVAIGIDHFSSRNVQMTSEQQATATPGGETPTATDGATDGEGAGFGVLVALAAIGAALVAMRRRQ